MIESAMIVMIAVLFNHLGMCGFIERRTGLKICCSKCHAFWLSLIYNVLIAKWQLLLSVFAAFLAAYSAVWIELFLGFLSELYENIYRQGISDEEDLDNRRERED